MNHGRRETSPIRRVRPDDLAALKAVIDATGLFPGEMLDGMIAPYFAGEATGDVWLTYDDGAPVAVAYHAPERMTSGTRNLLLMAVHPDRQGGGVGAALMAHVEAELAASGERILLVETSGLPDFTRTRRFYGNLGYGEEARIREFYQAGEDKIVFRKDLGERPGVTDLSRRTEMTTIEDLWQRYSASWSNPDKDARAAELAACLAEDATYCDPNGLIEGREELSAYMAGYQQQTPPGAHFDLRSVTHHHDRSLAHWAFVDAQGHEIYTGSSFGALAPDGRLRTISGFFYPPSEA